MINCLKLDGSVVSVRGFKGLYLRASGHPYCFSFVTYTPQSKEQMIACGDLQEGDEYINPVVLDFLLFVSEVVLGLPSSVVCPIGYDDVAVRWARQRGDGVQHEYLIQVKRDDWNDSKQLVLHHLQSVLLSDAWNGSRLMESN